MYRDRITLFDIVEAAGQIRVFLGDMSQVEFIDDPKTQSAVLYQLLVIGEGVKRLSKAFRSQHNTVPWALIAGMRDHLIHAYDTVDWEEVWSTVTRDIPALLDQIEPLLPKDMDS